MFAIPKPSAADQEALKKLIIKNYKEGGEEVAKENAAAKQIGGRRSTRRRRGLRVSRRRKQTQ